jgi:hypothetical protein
MYINLPKATVVEILYWLTGGGSGSDNESEIGRKKKKKAVGSGSDSDENMDGKANIFL